MGSSSCSGLMCQSEPFPDGCEERQNIQNQPSAGALFCAVIGRQLRRWTSSPFRQSRSERCVASSLSATIRRRILHVNVTPHPTSSWIVQQLREAFPFECTTNHLILDRDGKFGLEVLVPIRSLQIIRSGPHSKVPGRTELRSAAWKVADVISWIT